MSTLKWYITPNMKLYIRINIFISFVCVIGFMMSAVILENFIFLIFTFIFLGHLIFCVIEGDIVFYRSDKITRLINGETKEFRKEQKKLLKLKAQKKYLETKKARKQEMIQTESELQTLKCQVHSLELELKGKMGICEHCGEKVYRRACYCSQCGGKLNE